MEPPERVSLPEGFEDVDVDILVQLVGAQHAYLLLILNCLRCFLTLLPCSPPCFSALLSGHDGTARRSQRQNTSISVRLIYLDSTVYVAIDNAYTLSLIAAKASQDSTPEVLPASLF